MGVMPSADRLELPDAEVRARATAFGIDLNRLPKHVAIVMDGNGRWAEARALPRLRGHLEGYKTLRRVVLEAAELGISVITAYVFSTENWKRPEQEIKGLFRLIEQAARDELRVMHQNNVRVVISGRLSEMPSSVQRALLEGVELTKNNTRLILNLAVNYGGRAEVVDAVRSIARKVAAKELDPDEVDEQTITSELYQPGLPEPDLIIRTAGEHRISNFLLWQSAYAEYYVCKQTWPDFDEQCFFEAIREYQGRIRKFGGIPGA